MSWFSRSLRGATLGALLLAGAGVSPAHAGIANCRDVYVSQIFIDASGGAQIKFADSPTATTASNWTILGTGMTEAVYQRFYSMLLTAKATGALLWVDTNASDSCSITTGGYSITQLYLRPGT